MKFDFFTLGGGQFWEDVFFYQKWRIQRNYKSKEYRLLDNWDIQRHSGSFESCRKAFVKFIEVYEISRQKGHMIIMLHGLGDTKNIFQPLWRAAIEDGFMAAAINYPSTLKKIESHVRQLDFFLNHLEDVREVSFVTKGSGGIVLRHLLSLDTKWRQNLKINRIVQICPPNQGSRIFEKLNQSKIAKSVLGPMLGELTPKRASFTPIFPNDLEVGIVSCNSPLYYILGFLPHSIRKLFQFQDDVQLSGIKSSVFIKNLHWNVLRNKEVVKQTMNFIRFGKFSKK